MASSKFTQAVETYFTELRLVRGSGGATNERSFYVPLANLLDGLGGTLRPKVFCSQELADQGTGHPDFGLYANRTRVEREAAGWVEPERGPVCITIAFTQTRLCKPVVVSKEWQTSGASLPSYFQQSVVVRHDQKPLVLSQRWKGRGRNDGVWLWRRGC